MYAGRVVERADATALFRAPRHPYSVGLLSSFPALHGPRQHMTGIPGSPPDLRRLPAGCVFHPRCPYVMDRCRTEVPPLLHLNEAGGRVAACWLQDGSGPVPAELAAPVPGAGLAATPAVAAPGPAPAAAAGPAPATAPGPAPAAAAGPAPATAPGPAPAAAPGPAPAAAPGPAAATSPATPNVGSRP